MPATAHRSPLLRIAVGLGLAVLALLLLVQALVWLAVDELSDDYVRRFMRGTVDMLVQQLAPLDGPARLQKVQALDRMFVYPVAIVPVTQLNEAQRQRVAGGELLVLGLNRRIYARLPGDEGQVLLLGPLNADWRPGQQFQLPRELWLQLAAALGLALAVFGLAWWLLRPAWRDLRALQRAADEIGAGRFDAALPVSQSRLFAPLADATRATLERLAGALAAQRELTGAVSHELRTPLARLRFAIDALVDEDDAARREQAVQACEKDIDELDALIDASLLMARLDVGALQAELKDGDLAALLRAEAASLAPLLDGRALSLDLQLPECLRFDARLLPYALRNGLRNAARHARSQIRLSAWVEGGQVLLALDDDGEGIPEALREAVFTPFKRLDGRKERASRGFGLGLAIVRRIAEIHGGEARMASAPELGGARLLISWPQ
ncbi:ATP-binding protein [Paucibacter sp. APW11]|uniref:histidine kinase n=1 Tax=Roseateles aquae TaxID=3077235 RepID=A0ABU3P9Y8_9BURK|nr:ATP-binding protein [Paucibacter sp. APW11]MDT8999387.1 ATP-binding protein [Paucibacter sp. APW11]